MKEAFHLRCTKIRYEYQKLTVNKDNHFLGLLLKMAFRRNFLNILPVTTLFMRVIPIQDPLSPCNLRNLTNNSVI